MMGLYGADRLKQGVRLRTPRLIVDAIYSDSERTKLTSCHL